MIFHWNLRSGAIRESFSACNFPVLTRAQQLLYVSALFAFCLFLHSSWNNIQGNGQFDRPIYKLYEPRSTSSTASTMSTANTSRHFVYHKLHKTGSTVIENVITVFCKRNKLTCLTSAYCSKLSSKSRWQKRASCHIKADKVGGQAHVRLVVGSFTPSRLKRCCDHYSGEEKFDGLAIHLPLYIEENFSFINERTENAIQFTMVRHPIDQFISYWKFTNRKIFYGTRVGHLEDTVHRCLTQAYNQSDFICFVLTNSQSKELGWDGLTKQSLSVAVEFLETLDAVGIYEQTERSWSMFERLLGWPPNLFRENSIVKNEKLKLWPNNQTRASKIKNELEDDLIEKIAKMQWADMLLYKQAQLRFENDYKRIMNR